MKELLLKLVASDRKHLDGALLFLRLFIGGMMLSHGWAKLASFSTLSATFPDPLGVGSTLSLLLILFAEVGCSCLLIFGLMTRLAALPLDVRNADGFFRYSWCRSFCSERSCLYFIWACMYFCCGAEPAAIPWTNGSGEGLFTGRLLDKCRNIGSPEFFVFDDKRTGKKPVKQ
ncbi:MAG: DoxX family protein [Odoribacter splanchnicus]